MHPALRSYKLAPEFFSSKIQRNFSSSKQSEQTADMSVLHPNACFNILALAALCLVCSLWAYTATYILFLLCSSLHKNKEQELVWEG